MYYLQNKPSTSFLCLVEPELWSLKDGVRAKKTCFFSNFLMVISQKLHDIKKKKIHEVFFYHVLQLYQISKQSEGVRGKTSKNLLN